MDNVIARVATATNVSPEVARKAVGLLADFIQREASEDAVKDLFEKAPELQAIIASSAPTGGEGMGYGLKGLMGIAAGAMGGGGLMDIAAGAMGGGGLMGIAAGAMGGGGLMALCGELMGLGLSLDQIQAGGREVFAYGREVAGDQTIGEITASIPGLSQFI
jgi:hypothetical protein